MIKQTFGIYRGDAEGFLKGSFSEEAASGNVNGDHGSVILDWEIFLAGWMKKT